jgi:hypothetical protein
VKERGIIKNTITHSLCTCHVTTRGHLCHSFHPHKNHMTNALGNMFAQARGDIFRPTESDNDSISNHHNASSHIKLHHRMQHDQVCILLTLLHFGLFLYQTSILGLHRSRHIQHHLPHFHDLNSCKCAYHKHLTTQPGLKVI